MVPILSTPARLVRTQTKTLEHRPLLLKRVIVALAPAEAIAEVLIVFVVGVSLLRVDAALGVGFRIDAQAARARCGIARGTAIAGEVALVENLNEGVLAVAGNRTGIADASRVIGIGKLLGRWVAGEAGKDTLAEGAQRLGAVFDTLQAC